MSNPPFTVRAVFEYASGHDEDLSFPIGQIVTVTAVEDDEWYYGEYTDGAATKHEGIFPKNFVEKYDPPAPPRPTRPSRPKKDAESAPVEPPVASTESRSQTEPEVAESAPAEVEPPASKQIEAEPPQSPQGVSSPAAESYVSHQPLRQPARSAAAPAASTTAAAAPPPPVAKSTKPPPPAVAEKPSGSSFRDRIAAFNQSAAAPVAPFKPGGSQQSTSFIKKQFVAPPPSKDSFVVPPREPAPKVYRREEDPDVKEQLAREPPVSENRPPPPAPAPLPASEEGSEDQPKPTSLKERIALLQKQQLEQSQRHAEAAQKKEKAKAVAKRPVEQQSEPVDAEPALATSPTDPAGTARDPSVETVRARAPPPQPAPFSPSEEAASESNDADYSASEDAGETSASKDEDEERLRKESTHAVEKQGEEADVEEDAVEPEAEEEDEEEELDPETRRRMELRARMAKMSGGMGMMGLFGPPGGLPGMGPPPASRKPKTPGESEKRLAEPEPTSPLHAPPVPLPGMNTAPMASTNVEKEGELQEDEERPAAPITEQHTSREVPDVEDVVHEPVTKRRSVPKERSAAPAPPVPGSRPMPPPPVPSQAPGSPPSAPTGRPVMPPPRPSTGDESDDELSVHAGRLSINEPAKMTEVPAPALPDRLDARRPSTYDSSPPSTATSVADKRASRAPPPVPTNPPLPPAQNRAPPPPPPGPPRRPSTVDSHTSAPRQAGDDIEGEVTEYDGDYDTDIASGAKHKDALKARERDSSIDEGTITDDQSLYSARSPTEARLPPPLPPTAAPRGVPPPPPSQPPRSGRASIDTPRGPPPLPPSRDAPPGTSAMSEDEEYDPFNYAAPRHGLSNAPPPPSGRPEAPPVSTFQAATGDYGNAYDASPMTSPVHERPTSLLEKRPSLAPPPPPQSQAPSMPSPSIARSRRASMDLMRNQRRSMDISRPSIDQSFIATDVDLGEGSLWWSQPNTIPPIFQNRKDVLYEIEESSVPNNGGSTTISKDIYVLFMDYSQTVVTVQYDGKNPSDAHLEQRQEPPPHQPRQDQLEQAHFQIGTRISEAVNSIQNSTVGDGTPSGLIQHLLKPLSGALLPVGTRAYGALVYSNLANASVTQNDEIRAGDIVSFRNARFQGHRGTMHQKYSAEVGKPDHVGIVVDWDGTKKKIRAWEQGRESKKVKMESFKLNDLRSGECKVWRVMPRSWVSWESAK
ncbi:Uncharacterized protein PECH_005135 [Penicillium ucsense]|uniref:SH3 domain-containing protein n=1 Tax=Penicillium ucsense TaxID=2839758 RepID=A0A8J8WHL9_9EURO|nr:Uncharacterized protein PECM_005888 [Penicillium ucsense]KAF7736628.1 Uncharacterized protein PECH_005135 [Penicillium ucsense]